MSLIDWLIKVIFDELITLHLPVSTIQPSDHKSLDHLMELDLYSHTALNLLISSKRKENWGGKHDRNQQTTK